VSTQNTILCPSARCQEGAKLLGIVTVGGEVRFLQEQLNVDREFVEATKKGRAPEKRFRFADACLKSGCSQWTGDRCGVIEKMLPKRIGDSDSPELAPCAIRGKCRWFSQSGPVACSACRFLVTDLELA
jgi:hypothetical protein